MYVLTTAVVGFDDFAILDKTENATIWKCQRTNF